MKIILRNVVAVIVGLVIGGCVNMALVILGPHIVPGPAGVDMTDAKSIGDSIHLFEPKHFLFPFLAHAVGTLVGAMVAFLIAAKYREVFAYIVGVFFLAGGIAAATMIPAPKWFITLDLLGAYIPMAWLGTVIAKRILCCSSQSANVDR